MLSMGLQPLNPSQWIEPDNQWASMQDHKQQVMASYGDRVLDFLEESLPPQQELHQRLRQHLLQDHSDQFQLEGDQLRHLPSDTLCPSLPGQPLAEMSQWIQDDLCLLQAKDGDYRLTAASLCSPSFWHLEDKLGHTLDQIHTPVPGFAPTLAERVNQLLHRLTSDRLFWRANWSLVSHCGLLQRLDPPPDTDPERDPIWLRVERQSLSRLPKTGAVVFTIRVYLTPIEEVVSQPDQRQALRLAIGQLSPDEQRYKSLAPLLPRVRQLLSSFDQL